MTRTALAASVIVLTAWALWAADATGHETLTTTVRFDREIVSILDRRCVMCHSAGNLAFPLETYEQAWFQRRELRTVALSRHMPPWAAMPGYGAFVNDNGLTLRETQFLISWVEGMGPRSARSVFLNVADAAARAREEIRARPRPDTWIGGVPSLLREVSWSAAPGGRETVAKVAIDLGLDSPRWLSALQYRPGDRRVLRAAFFTIESTGQWVGSWTPWYGSVTLPSDVAYQLPAGARIVAELHYSGTTAPLTERDALGLFFAERPPRQQVRDLHVDAQGAVPAGADSHRFSGEVRVPAGAAVVALRPEFASGITSLEVSGRRPDGGTDVLLYAKDILTEWPTPYIFKTPLTLPPGTRLIVTAYYANPTSVPRPGGFRLTASVYQP